MPFPARLAWLRRFSFFIFHFSFFISLSSSPAQNIVINEIMYHPPSHDVREEFVELFNAGPTNVNLTGWRISGGIAYAFPSNTVIGAGNYLVVVADLPSFSARYPSVANAIGSWLTFTVTNVNGRLFTNYTPVLSNTRNAIHLNNAAGTRIDEVTYADDGDWAVRRRGLDDGGFRGWTWYAEHDGLGKSLELINAAMPNEYGQNWGPSSVVGGTPGAPNSIRSSNIAPLIVGAQHLPVVPRSTDSNSISARILNEVASSVTTTLRWRVDGAASFSSAPMLDDGAHGDGAAGDGILGALLPPMANGTIIEYYIQASDGQGNTRTWPAPALQALDVGNASLGQVANALFQVDDSIQNTNGFPPAYRLILTSAEYTELGNEFNSAPNSDAEMNATFISIDGSGVDRRYLCGVRNRGHGSRTAQRHNCRINFPSDTPWKGVGGLNMNSQSAHAQVLGEALLPKAGVAGNNGHFATLRVNNDTLPGGAPVNGGLYAANEDIDSDWADRQFPNNGAGNIYAVVRDIPPPNFDYRGEDPVAYQHTYFKQSNASENDWRDLMGMLQVMGENQTNSFTLDAARKVINVEQWLTHLAVMNLCGNAESGINTGNNDDYYLYRGLNDPRFILAYHDLDTIIGQGGSWAANDPNIFRATCCPISGDSEGIWRAMAFFMHHPQVEPLYYRTLQNLLDGPFSQAQFDPLVDQVFGDFPQLANTGSNMKGWMSTRRSTVQGVINGHVPPATNNPTATISGEPRSPTWRTGATLTVGGAGVTHYQWRLNNGAWSAETPVATPITLSGLATGSTNAVYVVGRNSAGIYQSTATPTLSETWVVNTALPTVRLNEVLARNDGAVNHFGTFPDLIELYNEGPASVTLTGMRLTDDPSNPGKFTFPSMTLAAGAYLMLIADSAGTPGIHLGFALGQNGDSVYLYNTVASGGARLDSVQFGLQLPNLSIGRIGNSGDWALTQPTFVPAAVNIAQPLGNPRTLKINEWLAASTPPTTEDFIELYNPDPLPVALGGLYLTDEPLGAPAMHRIADLSFVAGGGFAAFTADSSEAAGAEHLNFKLASEQGQIGLFASDLSVVDCIVYGPQRTDVSYGRCPNGSSSFGLQSFPSPGSGNSCVTPPPPPPTVNLMSMTNSWRWHENTNLDGVNWQASNFDDSGWSSGQALFGTANVTIGGQTTRTAMTADLARVTRYFRSSFVVPTNLIPNALQFYYIVDDGAVVYVNGAERARYNMPQGTVLFATTASAAVSGTPPLTGPGPFPLGSIQPGTNSIAVEVHQFPGGSGDCYLACRLDAILATNSPVSAGIVINEVLADNATVLTVNGRTPDVIELYNPSTNAVDLAGMSLNDSPVNIPPRWVFPPGSIVPARGYSVVYADGDVPASSTNTGFGLKKNGGSLFLFKGPPLTNDILDRVDYGLQTTDYSIGRVPAGSATWMLTVPTFGGTNVPATLGDPFGLRINEWMADPASGDDWFEIYNTGGLPVALADLRLTDVFGYADSYRIPALSFIGVGSNAFQRFEADDPHTPAGPEHVNFKLAKEGDNIYLLTSNNAVVLDSVNFGTQAMGVSEGYLPDGSDTIVRFPDTPTPGDANYLPLTSVVVNEILTHTDPPLEDAIELRNLTGAPVNIGGWFLSDDKDSLRKFRIPNNTTIAANGFLVFYEIAFNNDTNGAPFALSSADGDQVYLSEANGSGVLSGYRSVAKFGPAQNGVSFGRYVTSVGRVDYPALSARTFGQDMPASVEQFRMGGGLPNAYPKVGPIVISEIMYHPLDVIVPGVSTNDNVVEEFIELRNTSAATVPLYDPAHNTNGWRLRDAVHFTFNSSHFIQAGGHLIVVSFDPATNSAALAQFQAAYGTNSHLVGPYTGKLDNSSDSVELVKPDPPQTNGAVPYVLVEKVVYSDSLPWPTNADGLGMSLQRLSDSGYANDPTNWFAAVPVTGGPGAMDTDGDGMPDDWEMANGLNKSVADGDGDADLDGLTNLEEYLAGTNPQSAASTLRLVATLSPPNVNLQFNAVAGRTYSIVYSTQLPAVAWTRLANVPPQGTSGPVNVQDASGGPQRFYRVVTPAIP